MRPPICAVCFDRFSSGGGLVQFELNEAEKERLKLFKQPGFTGHPPGLEWFCEKHYDEAKKLKHLNVSDALKELKIMFGNDLPKKK